MDVIDTLGPRPRLLLRRLARVLFAWLGVRAEADRVIVPSANNASYGLGMRCGLMI